MTSRSLWLFFCISRSLWLFFFITLDEVNSHLLPTQSWLFCESILSRILLMLTSKQSVWKQKSKSVCLDMNQFMWKCRSQKDHFVLDSTLRAMCRCVAAQVCLYRAVCWCVAARVPIPRAPQRVQSVAVRVQSVAYSARVQSVAVRVQSVAYSARVQSVAVRAV